MDDELERFLRERKERVALDKAGLEQDPPYMEVATKPPRRFGSTVKENIPPNTSTHGKEESGSMGLPLGIEYERKKQKLQQELRMDYRHYMAQKKQFSETGPLTHLENWSSVKRAASQRDAATLTEGSSSERPDRAEPKERRPVGVGHRGRLDEPVERKDDELLEDGKMRDTAVQAGSAMRRPSRERREVHISAKAGRRSRPLPKNEDAEFATGLIIGAADAEAASQRRRERYRQELQEQIAEQHRNKKREKDLELKVAATGANDPEKSPDRIRQFGLHRRKDHPVVEVPDSGGGQTPPRSQAINEKMASRDGEIPPHELPRVAFQSPLLDYYSSLGGAALLPSSQLPAGAFSGAVEPHSMPRVPMFHPHPTLREAYRSQYGEPYQYYGTQNLLDPNMAYYGQLPVPAAGPPMMCWNSPPGETVPHQFGPRSPLSHLNGSSFPEPPIQSSSKTAEESQFREFPSERAGTTRERIMSYREALKQQIQDQQERRLRERKEADCLEAQLEAEMKSHQPWGRGGGGAPLRDSTGNLIADLNQMHKLNEEAYSNPKQWRRRAALAARQAEAPQPNDRVSGIEAQSTDQQSHRLHDARVRLKARRAFCSAGFALVQTPQFARGSVFADPPPQQKLQEQDQYKSFLKQQIEDKMRRKAEEREQIRLEEEKEERRLQEQRARIQREYEEEQEKKKQKEMEQKAKNEELIQLAEQRKREAERKKKEVEEKESATLRRQHERERRARVEEVRREPSPPIPTLQRKLGRPQRSPRPPTGDAQQSPAPPSERSLSGLQSPPVPARRNQLRAAGHQLDVFNGLSALRRQLHSEQKRLEDRMQQGDWEELDSPLSDRLRDRPPVDVFDMARLRLQVPVRRPNSRKLEPSNLLRIHDSLQLKNSDGESKLGFSEAAKQEEVGLTARRGRYTRDLDQQFDSQRPESEDDYFDLSPPRHRDYLGNAPGGSARGSLLQSESAFIDPLADVFPVPRTPEAEKTPMLSARQRRRLSRPSQQPQDWDQRCNYQGDRAWLGAQPGHTGRNRNGTAHLMDFISPDTAGPEHLFDDSPPLWFSPPNLNRHSSAETVATDPWMRPGTSDTLKGLGRPSKRERVAM
ncbi:centrosome and spindle pole-associated protein 1 isoform X2 [Nelusetta ayraudi]|uniref:centrosome and spindle pole-associated protein 1 isoform X2 n=1 Tax=Nelusetta ayraudi TaxID=303726 RepID=UPI003F7134D5